jgi:hypothetical protein
LKRRKKKSWKLIPAEDLKARGYPGAASGDIDDIFEVESDMVFDGQKWDGRKLQEIMIDSSRGVNTEK